MELHAEHVLFNSDLLPLICAYIDTGKDYKALIITCQLWHNVIASPKRAHLYMNLMSTLVVNHPEIDWNMCSIAYLLRPIELDVWLSQEKVHQDIDGLIYELLNDNDDIKRWVLKLPDWFIEKYPVINEIYDDHINLSRTFISTYISVEDQQTITQKRGLTLDIIERYCHLFKYEEWVAISRDDALDAEFIELYIDKLYIPTLCLNDSVTLPLIEKYINKVDWYQIGFNINLTPEFIDEHWGKFEGIQIFYNRGFDMNLVMKYYDAPMWDDLQSNPNLTRDFIRDNWHRFDAEIAKHPNVDEALICEHADEEIWTYVIQNPNVTLAFIEKHIARFEVNESTDGV